MYKYFDTWWFGLIIGLILPPVSGLFGTYFYVTSYMPNVTLMQVIDMHQLYDSVLQLSCLSNLIPFFILYNLRYDKGSKAVIGATFAFIIIVTILKFT